MGEWSRFSIHFVVGLFDVFRGWGNDADEKLAAIFRGIYPRVLNPSQIAILLQVLEMLGTRTI